MKCPICSSEMDHYQDLMGHIVMESEHKCIKCKQYAERFVTGCYEVGVKHNGHWFTWQWSYVTPANECKEIEQRIEATIAAAIRAEGGEG